MSSWDHEYLVFLKRESCQGCAYVCLIKPPPLIQQSLFVSQFSGIDWGGGDAAACRPWRSAGLYYRQSADCPEADFLSAQCGSFLQAQPAVTRRVNMRSRLIAGMWGSSACWDGDSAPGSVLKKSTITHTIKIYLQKKVDSPNLTSLC